jgi:hypothetical protein
MPHTYDSGGFLASTHWCNVRQVGSEIIFDPPWMRQRADDCETIRDAIKGLLRPADETVDTLRRSADGWTFPGSLDEMMDRWQGLTKLVRDELDESADKIRECADNHGRSESFIEEVIDTINPFD